MSTNKSIVRRGYCDSCSKRYKIPYNVYIFGGWVCKNCLSVQIRKIDKKNKKKKKKYERTKCSLCQYDSVHKIVTIKIDNEEKIINYCYFCWNKNEEWLKEMKMVDRDEKRIY